jgi:hypothetical protein
MPDRFPNPRRQVRSCVTTSAEPIARRSPGRGPRRVSTRAPDRIDSPPSRADAPRIAPPARTGPPAASRCARGVAVTSTSASRPNRRTPVGLIYSIRPLSSGNAVSSDHRSYRGRNSGTRLPRAQLSLPIVPTQVGRRRATNGFLQLRGGIRINEPHRPERPRRNVLRLRGMYHSRCRKPPEVSSSARSGA